MADAVYPAAEKLRVVPGISTSSPSPECQFQGLGDHMPNACKAHQDKQQRQVNEAVSAMWAQTKDRVGHLVSRLGTDAKTVSRSLQRPRSITSGSC